MRRGPGRPVRGLVVIGLLLSLVLAGAVSFYASSHPDGLEHVAAQVGFMDSAEGSATAGSPLADYGIAGVEGERLSGGLAGILGVVAVGVLAFTLMWLVRRRGPDGRR